MFKFYIFKNENVIANKCVFAQICFIQFFKIYIQKEQAMAPPKNYFVSKCQVVKYQI